MRKMMRIRLALVVIFITGALLVLGWVETTESLRFRSPNVLTYEQFVTQKPQEGWFRIKGAQLNVVGSAYQEDSKTHSINKAFVPLSSTTSDKEEEKTAVLMDTEDPSLIDTVREINNLPDEKAAVKFALAHHERAFITRDVEGMVQAGIRADSETRQELAKLDNTLSPDYVILKDGAHPSLLIGIAMLAGGMLLSVLQILYYLRRRLFRA